MTGRGMNDKARHIHLSGICGTAMASLAGLLQLEGHRITGSDKAAYPPMSDLLHSLGIPVAEPYAEANLDPVPDLVVIGNALSRGNPEVERVLDERIPFTSMAALLREEFLCGRESLVIAGTHGKTTTTSMLAWIYQVASRETPALEPSFLIGGVAENFGTSFQLRPTRTFILEGDEYDTAFFDKGPKFLHYFPDALILTHVEFDHADIYADLAAVKTAFKRLVNQGMILGETEYTAYRDEGGSWVSSNLVEERDDGTYAVTDGPWVETKEALGGFYLLEADDLDRATELARQIPAPYGGLEIRPIMPMQAPTEVPA